MDSKKQKKMLKVALSRLQDEFNLLSQRLEHANT